MNINFQEGVGFIVFVDLTKQENLFRQLILTFKKIDWEKEGVFFNYYGKDKTSEPHAKIWIRANESIITEVETYISNSNLEEKKTIGDGLVNSYVICSKDRGNLGEFDNFDDSNLGLIKIKEDGTKYAMEIIEELKVTRDTLTNGKLQEISEKLVNERPEIIEKFIKFHFIMNPLVHFYRGYETEEQVKQRCIQNMMK